MAYPYNGIPGYYSPSFPAAPYNQPQQFLPAQPAQQAQSGIQWVQGESGAKSFAVLPGQSALLMDSEAQRFYIKSVDSAGMPSPLRVFDFSERTAQPTQPKPDGVEFVTRTEFAALQAAVEALKGGAEHE